MNFEFKKIKIISLLFIFILSICFFGIKIVKSSNVDELNKEIEQKKNKIEELEKSIETYKKRIEAKQTEAVSLNNQISILETRIILLENEIEKTKETVSKIELEIEELDLNIKEKELIIIQQKEILAELIRVLYYENNKKFIEILTAYDNFSDFYNRLQYIQSIEKDMGQSTKKIRLAKENLEEKKAEAENKRKAYNEEKDKLENQKIDLSEQTKYKSNLLIQTRASEATYQAMLKSLKAQYQQIENEIVGIEQKVRKMLEDQDKFDAIKDDTKLSWPTDSRYVTAYFYDKNYPYKHIFEHNAIDIRASHGTAIKATKSGYVGRTNFCSTASCYSYVMIIHSGGMSTVYGHLSRISVSEGQFVTRGDIIGYSGGTPGTIGAGPFTTGPHLHFEVRINGIPVNPLNYLIKDW
jgi:murein DD-endopeptidase MepM/ murein hydrolase activator NlpD